MQPDTNYASLEGDRIGYQVFGHGPPDVVLTIGSFDRRGTGVSDRRRQELLPRESGRSA